MSEARSDGSENGGAGGLELENLGEAPGPGSTSPRMLVPLFLVPLLIVGVIVGVFLLIGSVVGTEKSLTDWIAEVETGGVNQRWQAAVQLSDLALSDRKAFDDPKIRERLRRLFESIGPQDTRIRQWLAKMWGQIGDAEATPLMLEGIERTTAVLNAPGGRDRAGSEQAATELIQYVRALGDVGARNAEPPILGVIGDPDADVRNAAAEALGSLGRLAIKSGAAPSEELGRALLRLHDDGDAWVRMTAALSLAKCDRAEGLPTLEAMLDREWLKSQKLKFPDDGRYSVNKFDPAAEPIAKALLAIDALVAGAFAKSGGSGGDKAPLRAAVEKATKDPNAVVQKRALALLAKLDR